MDKSQQNPRGGDADGPRKPPKAANEDREEKQLLNELDDTFPASDPPASTQPTGHEPPPPKPKERQSA